MGDAFVTYLRSDTDKATFKHDITLAEDYKMNISNVFEEIYDTKLEEIRSDVSAGIELKSFDNNNNTITLNGKVPDNSQWKQHSTLRYDSHTKRIMDGILTITNVNNNGADAIITVDNLNITKTLQAILGVKLFAVAKRDLSSVFDGGLNLDTNNLYNITENITNGKNQNHNNLTA